MSMSEIFRVFSNSANQQIINKKLEALNKNSGEAEYTFPVGEKGDKQNVRISQDQDGKRKLTVGNQSITFSKTDTIEVLKEKILTDLTPKGSSSPKFESRRTDAHAATEGAMSKQELSAGVKATASELAKGIQEYASEINAAIDKLDKNHTVVGSINIPNGASGRDAKIIIKQNGEYERELTYKTKTGDVKITFSSANAKMRIYNDKAKAHEEEAAKCEQRAAYYSKLANPTYSQTAVEKYTQEAAKHRQAAAENRSEAENLIDKAENLIASLQDGNISYDAITGTFSSIVCTNQLKRSEKNAADAKRRKEEWAQSAGGQFETKCGDLLKECDKLRNDSKNPLGPSAKDYLSRMSNLLKNYQNLAKEMVHRTSGKPESSTIFTMQKLATDLDQLSKELKDGSGGQLLGNASKIIKECIYELYKAQPDLLDLAKNAEVDPNSGHNDLSIFYQHNIKTAQQLKKEVGPEHAQRYTNIENSFSNLKKLYTARVGGIRIVDPDDLAKLAIKDDVAKLKENLKALLANAFTRNEPGAEVFLKSVVGNYQIALRALQKLCENSKDQAEECGFEDAELTTLENTEKAIQDALKELDSFGEAIRSANDFEQFALEETNHKSKKENSISKKTSVKSKRPLIKVNVSPIGSSSSVSSSSSVKRSKSKKPAPKGLPAAKIAIDNARNFTEGQLSKFDSIKGAIEANNVTLGVGMTRKDAKQILKAQDEFAKIFGVKLSSQTDTKARQAQLDPHLTDYHNRSYLQNTLDMLKMSLKALETGKDIGSISRTYLRDETISEFQDAIAYFSKQNPVPEGLKDFVDNWNQAMDKILEHINQQIKNTDITENHSGTTVVNDAKAAGKIEAAKIDPSILD